MELSEKFNIIKNIDGSYQLASQPQIQNIKFLNCWNCQARSVFTGDAKVVKCGECDSLNGIPGIHSVSNDEDKAHYLKCRECNVHLKTYEGVMVIMCPRCKTLNRLP